MSRHNYISLSPSDRIELFRLLRRMKHEAQALQYYDGRDSARYMDQLNKTEGIERAALSILGITEDDYKNSIGLY